MSMQHFLLLMREQRLQAIAAQGQQTIHKQINLTLLAELYLQ